MVPESPAAELPEQVWSFLQRKLPGVCGEIRNVRQFQMKRIHTRSALWRRPEELGRTGSDVSDVAFAAGGGGGVAAKMWVCRRHEPPHTLYLEPLLPDSGPRSLHRGPGPFCQQSGLSVIGPKERAAE